MTNKYTMRISRLTVDKLGVKLYDKVSAVIAELISNSYDADAQKVSIYAPMGQYLASKAGGKISDKGFEIKIVDDGAGMTPEEMQAFFLVIGAERRTDARRGSVSLIHKRKVMGRKGVGKLAPFGICKIIEVVSAGGEKIKEVEDGETKEGFRTSHILLDYDDIVANDDDLDKPYKPTAGQRDGTLSEKSGTEIILKNFNYRRVSNIETLSRQIAQRFGISSGEPGKLSFATTRKRQMTLIYSRNVGRFDVTTMPNTRIQFQKSCGGDLETIGPDGSVMTDLEAGFRHEGRFYELSGWVCLLEAALQR